MTAPGPARELLLAALRATPRRHRLPDLPAGAAAARAQGPEVAIAFALEEARKEASAAGALAGLFTEALADLVRSALDRDPEFQAQVLHAQDEEVRRFVALAQGEAADRRTVRTRVDAVAHPGKLRGMADAPLRNALLRLHDAASSEDWDALHDQAHALAAGRDAAGGALAALHHDAALERLRRLRALRASAGVQHYLAIRARRGPQAGSGDAARQGDAAARGGRAAEALTLQAFGEIAGWLDAATGQPRHRAAGSLRPPAGFPGAAERAKDEWDAAIVEDGADGAAVLLLAEVKLSPAAAGQDLPRLLRGLQRLAQARPGEAYPFACDRGVLRLAGASLRTLQPAAHTLPAQVFYACPAPPQERPALLGAAARALLLAQEASVRFALALQAGAPPPAAALAPVWQAIVGGTRLRAVLHQYETARQAREAMVDPRELLEALRALPAAPARR